MSYEGNRFSAAAFGPVVAEIAREQFGGRLTPVLRRRVRSRLYLTDGAYREILAEAERLLIQDADKEA